jgi:hypothetical protein
MLKALRTKSREASQAVIDGASEQVLALVASRVPVAEIDPATEMLP